MSATLGTFSDFRPVKSRSVVQLIIEVPIEKADEALAILGGVPIPGKEPWVGVARIDPARIESSAPSAQGAVAGGAVAADAESGDALPEPKERREWKSLKYAQRAGMLCNDPVFWQWLYETSTRGITGAICRAEDAANELRWRCEISSRSELDTNPDAAERYADIESRFLSYKANGEHMRSAAQ